MQVPLRLTKPTCSYTIQSLEVNYKIMQHNSLEVSLSTTTNVFWLIGSKVVTKISYLQLFHILISCAIL